LSIYNVSLAFFKKHDLCACVASLDGVLPESRSSGDVESKELPLWFVRLAECGCVRDPRLACVGARACATLLTGVVASRSASVLTRSQRAFAVASDALLPRIVERLWDLLEVKTALTMLLRATFVIIDTYAR
jgi:hypothetical protein